MKFIPFLIVVLFIVSGFTLILPANVQATPTAYFSEGFENGYGNWTGSPNYAVPIESSFVHSGNYGEQFPAYTYRYNDLGQNMIGSYSVTFWVFPTQFGSGYTYLLTMHNFTSNTDAFVLQTDNSGVLELTLPSYTTFNSTGLIMALNSWNKISVQFSSDSSHVNIILNGASVNDLPNPFAAYALSDPGRFIGIGTIGIGGNYYYDDISVINGSSSKVIGTPSGITTEEISSFIMIIMILTPAMLIGFFAGKTGFVIGIAIMTIIITIVTPDFIFAAIVIWIACIFEFLNNRSSGYNEGDVQ